jgi:hypothetical protein
LAAIGFLRPVGAENINVTLQAVNDLTKFKLSLSDGKYQRWPNMSPNCFECLEIKPEYIKAFDGRDLCHQCAELYYVTCEMCRGLIPRDESASRKEKICCLECFSRPEEGSGAVRLGTEELESLIADFIRLHAEEKRIKDRLEEIKNRLKSHAATEPRIANAVLLRAGESSIKCSYSIRTSYAAEKLAPVEEMLGADAFAGLFEREVKFSPIKEALETFLADETREHAETRNAIRAAMEIKEVVTVAPAASRSTSKKSRRT